jgi:hypothetical protein
MRNVASAGEFIKLRSGEAGHTKNRKILEQLRATVLVQASQTDT